MTARRQATLYLPLPDSTAIESLRSRFNPVQFELIRAHVTLCREDEVSDWDKFASRLSDLRTIEVTLSFGLPVRDDNLVYLPATGSTESYDALRSLLLSTRNSLPRKHIPHITIVHPRNGSCSDFVFGEIASQLKPFTATFRSVTLIEQVDDEPWQDLILG